MTTTLHHADIQIAPNRQRQAFDQAELLELAMSIKANGLMHAIVLRKGDGCTLVAGERRLRACAEHLFKLGGRVRYNGELLLEGHLPFVLANSDDPLDLEEAELAENVHRVDLTWQERADTTARLHKLRNAQRLLAAGESLLPAGSPQLQTVAQTALEVRGSAVGSAHDVTRREILIAAHMDKPEVAKAPDLNSAFKALKRLEEGDRNRALALAVGESFSTDFHQVLQGDFRQILVGEEWQGKFDVICTDPPYGMNAQDFGDGAGRLEGIDHAYDDSYEAWKPLLAQFAVLSYRVTKPEAHAYVWCDIDRFHELKQYMQSAGWYVFRTPLTNFKRNSGRVPLPDQGPRRQSEWCLYAIKGKKTVNYIASDVIVTDSDEQMSHGAQKPVALYLDLLKRSVKPGDWVLDCFAGTGTLIPTCHELKCHAVTIEQNPTYYGMNLKRLEECTKQANLL